MQSDATTVDQYLADLPEGRRDDIEAVRDTILANLPDGYEEVMNWGMITYQVPLERYPDTYNKRPLMYAGLASQKQHMAVYLSAVYSDDTTRDGFLDEYRATGKKLDMGKSCVRFTKLDNLPLDLIGKTIGSVSVAAFIEQYETARD